MTPAAPRRPAWRRRSVAAEITTMGMSHFSCMRSANVHHRHHEIEHDDIGLPALEHVERVASVLRGPGLIAVVFEDGDQQLTDVLVVIDDENTFSTHRRRVSQKSDQLPGERAFPAVS